jgi:peptide/nickel transport system substrate-binding protein
MFRQKGYPKHLSLIVLIGLLASLVACGGVAPAPVQEPAPAVQEEAQAKEEVVETKEEAAEPAKEEATQPESKEEAAQPEAAATEEAANGEAQEVAQAVQESKSAKELNLGVTVVTDEPDVSTPRTQRGGEYRDVATSDAVSFHPYLTSDGASGGYQGMVYTGGLLRLHENTLEYIPNMAESYTISEDGLTFTFKLRQDLKWSDGQPITAQDFKWTYDQVIKPENGYPYLDQLEFITGYEALDDYTLEIKIDKIYAPALGQMSGLITPLPKHVWEKLDWSDPEKNPEINSPSVVSGPYKLAEWKRDQFALFEANENYWYHGAPNIDRYSIEIVPDQDIAYQKMKSSETDTGTITPENLEEARQLENITVYEWWSVGASTTFVALNLREGFPTADINVRHGLNYAIDKDLLTEEVMVGQGRTVCSIYPGTSWAYNPDVPCYEYDQDKAIAEFAQAGYTFKDGQMLDKEGNQLTLKLLFGPNSNKVRELIAVSVQDFLAEIGVKVEIQALEWSSFLETVRAEEPEWDMVILSISSTPDPHTSFPWWLEENIPQMNFSAYINKDVERLFDEAAGTYDVEVRKEKYAEIQQIIAEDSPRIFLFYGKSWSGQNKRIQGIEPAVLGIGWNSEDWFIEE